MANFRTHITVAAAGGMLVAYAGWKGQWWPPSQAVVVIALVTFGGILPDIDADRSHSIRLIFNLLSVPAAPALANAWCAVGCLWWDLLLCSLFGGRTIFATDCSPRYLALSAGGWAM